MNFTHLFIICHSIQARIVSEVKHICKDPNYDLHHGLCLSTQQTPEHKQAEQKHKGNSGTYSAHLQSTQIHDIELVTEYMFAVVTE